MKAARIRFNSHKQTAKQRCIDFNFTFDEWYSWWQSHGVDKNYPTLALGGNQPCMCRYGDTGPYDLSNVYIDTNSNNVRVASIGHTRSRKTVVTPHGTFVSTVEAAEQLNISRKKLWSYMQKYSAEYYFKD